MLGGLFGGSSSQEQESTPWAPAERALGGSLDLVERGNNTPWSVYGGEQVAPFNHDQISAINQGRQWYDRGGASGINQMQNAAQGNLGAFGQANNAYQNQLNSGPVVNQGPDLAMAGAIANNPYLDAQIGAATRDIGRSLYEQQMPGIAAYSGGTGNLGNSRRGMLEAQAKRSAFDRAGDIAAQMRGNSFNQGIQQAGQVAGQNAQMAYGNQGMNLQAAGGLAGLGGQGMQGLMNAQNLQTLNQNAYMGLGNMQQQQAQNVNNQGAQNWYLGQQLPYQQAQMGAGVSLPMAQAFGTNTGGGGTAGNPAGGLLNIAGQLGGAYLMGGM